MKNGKKGIACFIMVLLTLSGWAGLGAQGQEFSADQILIGLAGEQHSRLYYKKDRWRVDLMQHGKALIQISRTDKGLTWMLVPEDKVYMQFPLFPDSVPWADQIPGEVSRENLGEEEIHGRSATKYRVKIWNGETAQEIHLWISQELKVPVKTATLDGKWGSELRNIRMETQPDHLFEVPSDFKMISPPPLRDSSNKQGFAWFWDPQRPRRQAMGSFREGPVH